MGQIVRNTQLYIDGVGTVGQLYPGTAYFPQHRDPQEQQQQGERRQSHLQQNQQQLDQQAQPGRVFNLINQLISQHPQYQEPFLHAHDFLMQGDGPLPFDQRHYIALMAASRHRCTYLADVERYEFVQNGGKKCWLQGIDFVPKKIRQLDEINQLLAHQPWLLSKEHMIRLSTGNDSWSLAELVHAITILAHFHALSSFVYGCGICDDHQPNQRIPPSLIIPNSGASSDCSLRTPLAVAATTTLPAYSVDSSLASHTFSSSAMPSSTRPHSPLEGKSSPKGLPTAGGVGGAVEQLMRKMRSISESKSSSQDITCEELARRFATEATESASISAGATPTPPSPTAATAVAPAGATAAADALVVSDASPATSAAMMLFEGVTSSPNGSTDQHRSLLHSHQEPHQQRRLRDADRLISPSEADLCKAICTEAQPSSKSSLRPDGQSVLAVGASASVAKLQTTATASESQRGHTERVKLVDGAKASASVCDDLNRFVCDPAFGYQDFTRRNELVEAVPTFRIQDYSWDDHGYSLANRLYNDVGTLLDTRFKVAYNMTYYTMGGKQNVDTSMFRRAIWNYIHCLFGIRHDDYDYKEVNELLDRNLKQYIKAVCCYPERVSKQHCDSVMREFSYSEKVHVNLMVLEARMQAELLYALRALMRYTT